MRISCTVTIGPIRPIHLAQSLLIWLQEAGLKIDCPASLPGSKGYIDGVVVKDLFTAEAALLFLRHHKTGDPIRLRNDLGEQIVWDSYAKHWREV